MRALVTLGFVIEWNMKHVLMYFRKPMLATRCVDNVLKFIRVQRDYSVDMML